MESAKKKYFSIIFKAVLVIMGFAGIIVNFVDGGFMGSKTLLLYFTIQSNITMVLIATIFLVLEIVGLCKKKNYIAKPLKILKYLFTVAITLTFLVFFIVLVPTMGLGNKYLYSFTNLSVHLIVPIIAIVDYIIFDYDLQFKKFESLYCTAMPLYYLIFALICSFCGVQFGGGMTVPYFFLDYTTFGWFSFSNGLGVAYWILLLTAVVVAIGYLFTFIAKKRYKSITKSSKTTIDDK